MLNLTGKAPVSKLTSCKSQVHVCEGEEAHDWEGKVQEAKEAVSFQAKAMATAYGKTLHVTADDILWGMGQVCTSLTLLGVLHILAVSQYTHCNNTYQAPQ